jgi:hypothetical protein
MDSSFVEHIFLSITKSYAPLWTSREGIREFVQNWYDAMREELKREQLRSFSIDKRRTFRETSVETFQGTIASTGGETLLGTLHFDTRSQRLTLENHYGKTLSKRILLLGFSSKNTKDKDHLVGQFGEGMKLGILAYVLANDWHRKE